MRSRLAVLVALLLLAVPPELIAGHELEISLRFQDGRQASWKKDIPDDEARDIIARPELVSTKYLTDAKKKLAERQGYSPAVYGADYWKLIQVSKWFFALREPFSNRVVASNRPI